MEIHTASLQFVKCMRNYLLQLFYTYSVGDYLTGSTLFSADRLLLEKKKRIQKKLIDKYKKNNNDLFWPLTHLNVIPHQTTLSQYGTAKKNQVYSPENILQEKNVLIKSSIIYLCKSNVALTTSSGSSAVTL